MYVLRIQKKHDFKDSALEVLSDAVKKSATALLSTGIIAGFSWIGGKLGSYASKKRIDAVA